MRRSSGFGGLGVAIGGQTEKKSRTVEIIIRFIESGRSGGVVVCSGFGGQTAGIFHDEAFSFLKRDDFGVNPFGFLGVLLKRSFQIGDLLVNSLQFSVGPTWDAITTTNLLENGGADAQLLRDLWVDEPSAEKKKKKKKKKKREREGEGYEKGVGL